MVPEKPRILLVDLHGTLASTGPFISKAFAETVVSVCPDADRGEAEKYYLVFFNPLEKKLVNAIWFFGKKRVFGKAAHRLVNRLLKRIGSMPLKPYADVVADLRALRKEGWKIFLSTDNPVWVAKSIVRSMGIENLFDGFLGKPRTDEHKVASHVRVLARRFGIKPRDFSSRFAFYGDTPEEMHFARELGLLAIGRTTNFSAKKMRAAGAHKIVVGTGKKAQGRLAKHVLHRQAQL